MGTGAAVRRQSLFLVVLACALAIAMLPKGPPTGLPVMGSVDLLVRYITVSPSGPVTGNTVTVTAVLLNDGDTAAGGFDASFYVDGTLKGTQSVTSLAGGGQTNVSFIWTAESGGHEFRVFADSGGSVAEANEGNNNWYETVGVDYPMKGLTGTRTSVSNAPGPTNLILREYGTGTFDNLKPTLVYNGKVYVTDGSNVMAYNASNVSQQLDTSSGLSNIQEFGIYKGVLYTPSGNNRLYALNASNLSQSFGYFQKPGAVSAIDHIAFYRDYVYASTYENIYQLNASDISQRITNYTLWGTGTYFHLAAVYNNTVYVTADTNRILYALNASNVAQVVDSYTHPDNLQPQYAAPSIRDGVLYIAGGAYRFWALDANNLNHQFGNITNVGLPDTYYSAPPTVWDDKVGYGSVTVPNKATFMVFNASNVSKSLYNITVGVATDDILWPAIATNNGVVYFASESNSIYARNATDLSSLSSYAANNDLVSFAIGPDGTIYAPTSNRLYALTQKPSAAPTGPADHTQVDRDSVNASVDDSITLEARLSDGKSGVTVTFSIDQNAPTSTYSTSVSNTSVNGVARYTLNPGSAYYAGEYIWSPSASGYDTNGTRYFDVYGGLMPSFRNSTGKPETNASYRSGDTIEVDMNISSMGPETMENLLDNYNAAMSATLRPPTEAPIALALTNTTGYNFLANGTMNSSCEQADGYFYLAVEEDLVPSAIPSGPWCGTAIPDGYRLGWTCSAAACPGQSGKTYQINDSDSTTGCGGTWWGLPKHDWIQLQGFPVYNAGNCPGTAIAGWTFNITGPVKYWYGSHTLATETGTWTAVGNATADYFFTNGTSRTFTVTGAAAAAPSAPSGGGAIRGLSVTVSPDRIFADRGTSASVNVTVKNIGDIILDSIALEVKVLPYGWAAIMPSKIDKLERGESKSVMLTLNIPDIASPGVYTAVISARNAYLAAERQINITVTAVCKPCPAPGEWGECREGRMSRTNYRCGPETDLTCVQWTEETECLLPPEVVNNAPLLLMITMIAAVIIGRLYWAKPKPVKQPQPTGKSTAEHHLYQKPPSP
ncbi:MAG: CARDB domain-containing protein [Candidatus Aenigmatarchaeota archaeon]